MTKTRYDFKHTNHYTPRIKEKLRDFLHRRKVILARLTEEMGFKTETMLGNPSSLLWEPDLIKILDLFKINVSDFLSTNNEEIFGETPIFLTLTNHPGRKPRKLFNFKQTPREETIEKVKPTKPREVVLVTPKPVARREKKMSISVYSNGEVEIQNF